MSIEDILLKISGTTLEEESAKGAYASTPQSKCDYVRRQGASQGAVDFYCKDLDERKAKEKATGKKAKGRKDVRDILSKRAFAIPELAKKIGYSILRGVLGGGLSAGIGGAVAGINEGRLDGVKSAYKGIIPGVVGELGGDVSREFLPDSMSAVDGISPMLGYLVAAVKGYKEERKKSHEGNIQNILKGSHEYDPVRRALVKKVS